MPQNMATIFVRRLAILEYKLPTVTTASLFYFSFHKQGSSEIQTTILRVPPQKIVWERLGYLMGHVKCV